MITYKDDFPKTYPKIKKTVLKGFKEKLNFLQDECKKISLDKELPIKVTREATKTRIKQLQEKEITIEKFVELTVKRYVKQLDKEIQEEINRLNEVSKSEVQNFTVSIEWKQSRTWGSNPSAMLQTGTKRFYSGSVSGCGFDKGSTAFSCVLNQYNGVLKLLYDIKEKNITISNTKLFGYGSANYRTIPYFEKGVGIDCSIDILKKLNITTQKHYSKNSDFFICELKK